MFLTIISYHYYDYSFNHLAFLKLCQPTIFKCRHHQKVMTSHFKSKNNIYT